jgi:hypothetical protein
MWLFTKHGFYSAVCARQAEGRYGAPLDASRIMVRARVRAHLDALKTRFEDVLGACEVMESPHTDYRWRIFVDKAQWSGVVEALAGEIDYDNFKGAVARHQGRDDSAYEHALHDVWSVMYELQRPVTEGP